MPHQDANGISIHYTMHKAAEESKQGPWIVLVNGLADDESTWELQIPPLLEHGFSVVTYDDRGVGQTTRPAGPYTAAVLAADLHALLLALSIREFHLLGISMGGMIAQSYALAYPNGSEGSHGLQMLSFSLCCTYAEPTRFCTRMFALWADKARHMGVAEVMMDVILWCFTLPYFRERSEELKQLDEAMQAIDVGVEEYLAQLNVIQIFDSTGELRALQKRQKTLGSLAPSKIMVLAGEEDILIPTQLSRELHELIPGSRWRTVKGGHCCALEFADEFNDTMLSFLTSV